ncbi:MAG: ogr/Delta-like zinc finger family protein, partial [Ignavibacteriaceae bacterium]
MDQKEVKTCPHCNKPMKKWRCPPASSWNVEFQYVCFNDECPYYINGWEWMKEKYNHNVSYRYRINPFNNESGPLPVCLTGYSIIESFKAFLDQTGNG